MRFCIELLRSIVIRTQKMHRLSPMDIYCAFAKYTHRELLVHYFPHILKIITKLWHRVPTLYHQIFSLIFFYRDIVNILRIAHICRRTQISLLLEIYLTIVFYPLTAAICELLTTKSNTKNQCTIN